MFFLNRALAFKAWRTLKIFDQIQLNFVENSKVCTRRKSIYLVRSQLQPKIPTMCTVNNLQKCTPTMKHEQILNSKNYNQTTMLRQ